MCLESLMHGRRLVYASGNRLEVFDVKNPWVEISVPADDIEGVVIKHVFTQPISYFDSHLKLAAFGVRFQFFGDANIALGIRRMFEHLSEFVSIAFGRFDLGWVFNSKETRFVPVNMHLPGCGEWNHNVITFAEF